ncbi:MAG TPA: hypothetical protein VGD98_15440 [Ktedonobacteraceae bacterium]
MNIQSRDSINHLLQHPVLVPGYRVITTADDMVTLRWLSHTFVLRGAVVPIVLELIALMDGTKDITQLAEQLHLSPRQLTQILLRLYQAKLIVDKADLIDSSDKKFGVASALSQIHYPYKDYSHTSYRNLQQQAILVVGSQDLTQMVRDQIEQTGLERIQNCLGSELASEQIRQFAPTFILHLERAIDYHTTLQINEIALNLNVPWVTGWLAGTTINITHVMIPGENACFECLLLRLRENYINFDADLAYEQFLRNNQDDLSFQISTPSIDNLLVSLVSMRAITHLIGYVPLLPAPKLIEFSTIDLIGTEHPVLRIPRCPACGAFTFHARTNPYVDDFRRSFQTEKDR